MFNSHDQKEGSSIDAYVGELRRLAQSCNFCTCLNDTLIRDWIVLGIRDTQVALASGQTDIPEMRWNRRVMKCRTLSWKAWTSPYKMSIKDKKHPKYPKEPDRRNLNRKPLDDKMSASDKTCDFCGRKHRRGRANCAAWRRVCGACGKKNHFASQCKAREKAHTVEFKEDESSEEEFHYCGRPHCLKWQTVNSENEKMCNEKPIKFHIDCGTRVNVLPSKYVSKEEIKPTKCVLQIWNKTGLEPEGACRITIRNPKNWEFLSRRAWPRC